jgi:hypothetical protein
MFLSRIFKTVKSLEIQNFDHCNYGERTEDYFKLNFPEVVTLKISKIYDLEHF